MVKILPTHESEYSAAFSLMRENMITYHESHQIPWDEHWVRANYRDKENYSLFRDDEWIGFLSIEWLADSVFIHTLQLLKSVQGKIFGIRVFEWLLVQADKRAVFTISCRSFRDNPALAMYRRLGFEVCGQEGPLLDLKMSISDLPDTSIFGACLGRQPWAAELLVL